MAPEHQPLANPTPTSPLTGTETNAPSDGSSVRVSFYYIALMILGSATVYLSMILGGSLYVLSHPESGVSLPGGTPTDILLYMLLRVIGLVMVFSLIVLIRSHRTASKALLSHVGDVLLMTALVIVFVQMGVFIASF